MALFGKEQNPERARIVRIGSGFVAVGVFLNVISRGFIDDDTTLQVVLWVVSGVMVIGAAVCLIRALRMPGS